MGSFGQNRSLAGGLHPLVIPSVAAHSTSAEKVWSYATSVKVGSTRPAQSATYRLVSLGSPARGQARDLFDSHRILNMEDLERDRLRMAFVVYGGMNRKDWRTVSIKDVDFDAAELTRVLIPTLDVRATLEQGSPAEYAARLVKECREGLSAVLPFTDAEREFLDLLLDKGEIDSTILTADVNLQSRIQQQPLLKWKALNVRKYKGLS